MKKHIITAALAVASLGAAAGTVDVSSVTAKAVAKGIDIAGNPVTFDVQLTDGSRKCASGTLEAVITNSRGVAIGCWRIIGDNVYLSSMTMAHMRDAMVPISAFEGDGVAKLQQTTGAPPHRRASAMAATQERASTGDETGTAARTSGPSGS